MRTARWSVSLAMFTLTVAIAGSAFATGGFPSVLQNDLALSYEPPCSVCHAGGKTGSGTVTTPFGQALRDRGLQPDDDASLEAALGKMMDEAVDSDGDGTTDIDELTAQTDPNTAGDGALGANSPQYGCGAQIAPGGSGAGSPGALGLALLTAASLAVQLRGRRARGRPSR